MAFELDAIDAAVVAGLTAPAAPAAAPANPQPSPEEIALAYGSLKGDYAAGAVPAESDLPGDWEGRAFQRDENGAWRVWPLGITFVRKDYVTPLGPLFQPGSHEIKALLMYHDSVLVRHVYFEAREASFTFPPSGGYSMGIRKLSRPAGDLLLFRTDGFGGVTYGYFFRQGTERKSSGTAFPQI